MVCTAVSDQENCSKTTDTPIHIAQLSDTSFLNRYDVFFLDVWGTLSDGERFYPEAITFLDQILAQGKRFIFVSNASRLSEEARKNYPKKGLPEYGDKLQVVTAGQTCVDDIATGKYGQKFYIYGKAINLPEGLTYTDNLDEASAVLMAMCNTPAEGGLTPHQTFLDNILARDMPVVCANADQWVFEGGRQYICSGHIARHYQHMGGKATLYGKPEEVMFEYGHKLCGLNVPKNRILMIGDSFETDIQGAHKYGIDSCVVLTGLYMKSTDLTPVEWMQTQAAEYKGIMPTYWCEKVQ